MSPLQVSTMTHTPGTLTYMPPEVMVDNPHYNTGIDRFSYGILMIQIFCGEPPRPQVASTVAESGKLIAVSEADRRKKYLDKVGYDHPLMNLILECIDNDPMLRPPTKKIVQQLEERVDESPSSFKCKLEILQFVVEREADRRALEKSQILELQAKSSNSMNGRNIVCAPLSLVLVVMSLIASYFVFQIINTPTIDVPQRLGRQAQNFVNTTFNECGLKKTINCDKLVPSIIHDLIGNISWRSAASVQTTMYQGQSVVIGDKVYYGGGFADDEVDKYYVYCYHQQFDTWTRLSAPGPVKSFGLGKLNDSLMVVGGITTEGEESKKVYTYNETNKAWMSVIPDMPISRQFPAVLSLSSAIVVAGGERSIGIYTQEKGWYWSNQPFPVPCSDVTLLATRKRCFTLAGNFTKELLASDWFTLSMYVSIDDLLYDRDNIVQGRAYENRNEFISPTYRWRELPGDYSTQVNSLVGTVLASNLVTLGERGQPWNNEVRMFSLSQETWTPIGELPDDLRADTATLAALSSTNLFVTGKNHQGHLSVYIGSLP